MKRLWKSVYPCESDIFGFLKVVNQTDGLGIIDDCSRYKLHANRSHHDDFDEGKVLSSNIHEEDIVCGTKQKVLEAIEKGIQEKSPKFILLTSSPCASMINTDYEEIIEGVKQEKKIPIGLVKLEGQKDYLYGVSLTLESLGKLLLSKSDKKIPNSVNILGMNVTDFTDREIKEMEENLLRAGFQVLTKWCIHESLESLKTASSAEINIVVNVSGLRIAKYMEQQLGIPYVIGCPLEGFDEVISRLKKKKTSGYFCPSSNRQIVIVGEQIYANTLREIFISEGFSNISVCSFYEMDETLMGDDDKKLNSEDDLKQYFNTPSLKIIFSEDDYRSLCDRKIAWGSLSKKDKFLVENIKSYIDFIKEKMEE